MRRVVICGLFHYPRGKATANYVQYLADALKEAGYQVTIIGYINGDYSNEKRIVYRDIEVLEISSKIGISYIDRPLNGRFFEKRLYHKLKTLGLGENDLIIGLSRLNIIRPILKLKEKTGVKTAGCPLEWFAREQFTDMQKADDEELWMELNNEHDLIFPISHKIASRYVNSNAKVTVLPIMADVAEYPFIEKERKKYEFIFPASGMMKDALESMLLGLTQLNGEQLANITFHLTGVKEDVVKEILQDKIEKVRNCLVIHSWMKYEELINLYQSVHYLFLAREVSQMTMSNFPSKVPEVMTHGIVPVVSRVGDYTKYYLEDNVNSLIFDGCSVEDCRSAMERALELPFEEYLKLSSGARKCVEQKFDYHNWIEVIHESVEAIYK